MIGNRKCRFCGKRDGETRQCVWPLTQAITALGLSCDRMKGENYAHPKCLKNAQLKFEKAKEKK